MTTEYTPATITKITGAAGGPGGFNGVVDLAAKSINDSAAGINAQMAKFDPTDPGALLKMQQQLANYNLAITVTASIIKSLEDTVKSVAQKL